jgi:hypothetical protein
VLHPRAPGEILSFNFHHWLPVRLVVSLSARHWIFFLLVACLRDLVYLAVVEHLISFCCSCSAPVPALGTRHSYLVSAAQMPVSALPSVFHALDLFYPLYCLRSSFQQQCFRFPLRFLSLAPMVSVRSSTLHCSTPVHTVFMPSVL